MGFLIIISLPLSTSLTGPCGKGDVVEQCALPDQTPAVVLRLTEALERLGEFALPPHLSNLTIQRESNTSLALVYGVE